MIHAWLNKYLCAFLLDQTSASDIDVDAEPDIAVNESLSQGKVILFYKKHLFINLECTNMRYRNIYIQRCLTRRFKSQL